VPVTSYPEIGQNRWFKASWQVTHRHMRCLFSTLDRGWHFCGSDEM